MTLAEPMERMTFGDDGSSAADAAWEWVTNQVWPGWRVDVLQTGTFELGAGVERPRVAPSRCGFTSVRTLSTPLEMATALTGHLGTDLIVVGGQPGAAAATAGRAAESVLTRATVPVLVARSGESVRSVLACVDPPRHFRAAVDALLSMPWVPLANVTVLAVRAFDGTYRREADRELDRLTAADVRASLRVVEPHPTVAASSPKHRIFDTIDRLRPDLVVIGADRRSRMLRTFGGSPSHEVVRYAPCSVLVARTT